MTNGRQKQGDDCATALLAQLHRKPAASVAERARLPGKELAGPSGGRWLPYRVACPGPPPASRRPLLPAPRGAARRLWRPPTTPGREWRQQSFLRCAAWAYGPAGTRQVDPGGRTLLPAPDPLRDPPESLGGVHSLHPELPAPGSQSARSSGTKSVDSVEPKATFLGEGSPIIGSRITLPAEGRRQQE